MEFEKGTILSTMKALCMERVDAYHLVLAQYSWKMIEISSCSFLHFSLSFSLIVIIRGLGSSELR